MRQLLVQVPKGQGQRLLTIAEKYNPINIARYTTVTPQGPQDVTILHVSNRDAGPLLEDLSQLPGGQFTLNPHEVLTMRPPDEKVADSIAEVERRSPIEVWLNGLQSIGSWKSFIGYIIAASIVVWIGLYTNTIYLLVAAMLISPFGGPAMNTSLATASGDTSLLRRSVLRYGVGLLVMIATTSILSLLMQLGRVTNLMLDVGQLSSVAALLPLVTGAIGAMNLIEPERNSLVPGTAVGLLVAAALAPPAGVAGMALSLQEWSLASNMLFVLALQLVMINLSGALVFRFYGGLTWEGGRYQRGRRAIFMASVVGSLLVGVGLLWLQFQNTPALQRSTRAQRAVTVAEQVLDESDLADFVSANFRSVEPSTQTDEILLGIMYVQRKSGVVLADDDIEAMLVRRIHEALRTEGFQVTPLLTIAVLESPEQTPGK